MTNLLYSVILTTSFFTTLLNLAKSLGTGVNLSISAKSLGTGVNLSISNLSTSVFKLAKFDFSAKLLTSTCDTF